jgi:glycosyltransferase involved in cell wall biosynthesis
MLKIALVDELHNLKKSGVYHSNEDVKKILIENGANVKIFAIKKRGRVFNTIVAFPYLRDLLILPLWNRYIFSLINKQGYDVAVIRTTNNLYLTKKTKTKKVIYTGSIQTRQLEILLNINCSIIKKFIILALYPVVYLSELLSLKKADAILVSKKSFSLFLHKRFGLPERKTISLPGITTFDSFSSRKNDHPQYDVLFVGRLSLPKNWPMVVEIAKKTDFKIAAATPDKPRRLKGVPSNITVFSQIPRAQMSTLYHSSLVFLMPSFMEGGPKCTLEAMISGLPVVASPDGADDFVLDGENGKVIINNDSAQYITAIKNFMENTALAKKIGRQNKIRARKFNSKSLGPKYYSTLLKIARGDYNIENGAKK